MSSSSSHSSSTGVNETFSGAITARRRFAAVAAAVAAEETLRPTPAPRKTPRRTDWLGHVCQEGPLVFKRMYRMDLYFFNYLVRRIKPFIETENSEMAVRSAGSAVCTEVRLSISLRYLAGGAVWDTRSNFCVSACEFYRSTWRVIDALNYEFPVDLDLSDTVRLKELELGFARKSRQNAIRGVIGAIDGCLLWQKNPGVEVDNPNRYYCARKEKFTILLIAVVDADRRIIWFDMSCSPSTHDSPAWNTTELGQRFERGEVPDEYFLIGDSAFTCTSSLITPGNDDALNFEQSLLRINVECAFSELIRRWGILWRPLEMEFRKRPAVVGCCIRLYNFCINCRIQMDEQLMNPDEVVEVMPGMSTPAPYVNENGVPEDNLYTMCKCMQCRKKTNANVKKDTRRREKLEAVIRDHGLRRPYPKQ